MRSADKYLARVKNYWEVFSLFGVNVRRGLFRAKPTASLLESSFDPDIQLVKIKSHDNDVFYEISVVARLTGNTGSILCKYYFGYCNLF